MRFMSKKFITVYNSVKKFKGFTLIEVLVFLFIFTVAVLSFYQAFNIGMNYTIEMKKKVGAVGLANEEIEKMRNLGYENLQEEDSTEDVETEKNGMTYYVTKNIVDFDEVQDGFGGLADPVNWDYKKIRIDVYWALNNLDKMISESAIVVPPVVEKEADKGYIRLHVINQDADGLGGAEVTITDLTNGGTDYTGFADSGGNIFVTGLKPGLHKIAVIGDSDDNYPVETKDETASFDPADKHANISGKTLTEKTIQTDIESVLNITLKNAFNESTVSGLQFDITGGKFLGVEDGTDDVYNFSDSGEGGDGTENYEHMSFGPYFFDFTDLNDGITDYQLLWMNPAGDAENQTFLNANETLDAEALMAPENVPSLLVTVEDINNGNPIEGASVRLVSGIPGYDEELSTNKFGKAYFFEGSEEGEVIANGQYDYTVSADGYGNEGESIEISNFTAEDVPLTSI